jgi:hypothetical protein
VPDKYATDIIRAINIALQWLHTARTTGYRRHEETALSCAQIARQIALQGPKRPITRADVDLLRAVETAATVHAAGEALASIFEEMQRFLTEQITHSRNVIEECQDTLRQADALEARISSPVIGLFEREAC